LVEFFAGFCPQTTISTICNVLSEFVSYVKVAVLKTKTEPLARFCLEEKGSRAKIEKREKCFALRCRQAGGAAGRVSSVQSRFALRSVIATR